MRIHEITDALTVLRGEEVSHETGLRVLNSLRLFPPGTNLALRNLTSDEVVRVTYEIQRFLDSGDEAPPYPAQYLGKQSDLAAFAAEHGLTDWHEPDEQGINAYVLGSHLDNAGFPFGPVGSPHETCGLARPEYTVIITKDEVPVAYALLADVLAWASAKERWTL